ncbi:MAG: CpaF family protein [Planctomycetota bacterium]|nr:MAG: CpaF family protein [Planctomycetota bacterium]
MGLFTKKPQTTEPQPAPESKPAASPQQPAAPRKIDVTRKPPAAPAEPPKPKPRDRAADERLRKFHELKSVIHRKLVEQLDMSKLNADASKELREQVREVVVALCDEEDTLLNPSERSRLAQEILDETFGLGPLESLLSDPGISDILINGPHQVYIEKGGRLTLTDVRFKDNSHLLHIIDKIVSPLGRRCDEVSPMVDARLKDGSRVNAIIPPLAIDGASVSIRRFGKDKLTWDDYIRFKSCAPEMVSFFEACVKSGLNILIAGGTGSGKTTLLNNLSSFIPSDERIVTIEDAAELQLRQPHVVRLETRPPNLEGKGQITIRDLLVNSLRMRPDRIVVGECRGGETLDMLQAMNTGHEGSMTTVHANNTRDCVQRVETMVMMSGFELPQRAIRQQFASAIDLIVQAARLTGGPRKIISVTEVQGMEGDVVVMQDIFRFEQDGVDSEGKAFGRIVSTGVRPQFMDRLIAHGCDVSPELFTPRDLVSDHEE